MTTLVKIHRKGQMTLPSRFRTALGVAEGSVVELSLKQGKAILTPKQVIDRGKFPNADDEYTPAQRRIIDAQLDEAEKGLFHGPFDTAAEMIAHMRGELKKRAAIKKTKRPR